MLLQMALSVGGTLTGRREDGKRIASIEDRQGTGKEVGAEQAAKREVGLVGPPQEIRLSGRVGPRKREAVRNWLLLGPSREIRGLPSGSDSKESACNAEDTGDVGLIPELGRSPGGGCGNPLQYSCLENPHGQRSLAGYSPWGHKELDTTQ